jgi:pSer/pThr/pTyr-binding forkhead associated (FHA) protein
VTAGEHPGAKTLSELVSALRAGFVLHRPVLVEVSDDGTQPEGTYEQTTTITEPIELLETAGREYAHRRFLQLGANRLPGPSLSVRIGRSRVCEVRIDNDSVSKVHATFVYDAPSGDYFLVDENSRNGTFVNGVEVAPGARAHVWAGCYTGFGDAVYVFLDPPTLRQLARLLGAP